MAKKTTSKTQQRAAGAGRPKSHQAWLAGRLKSIKAFSDRQEPLSIIDYWELGRRASKVMELAEKREISAKPNDIATKLGHQSDASLRQAIKFADGVTKNRAQALQDADVPWRGVVYWLGIESKADSRDLYQRMLKGLTNSNKIRLHIANKFNKQALPRKSADVSTMAEKTGEKAHELTALLLAFVEVCNRSEDLSTSERNAMRRQLKALNKALVETGDQIRSTRSQIRRLS